MTTTKLIAAAAVILFVGSSLVGLAAVKPFSPSPLPDLKSHFKKEVTETPSDVDARLHQECIYPVIQIREVGKKTGASGFVVRCEKLRENVYYNLFLTCAHCVSDDPMEAVVFLYEDWSHVRKKIPYRCIYYGVEEEHDVALGYFISDQRVPTANLCQDCKLYIGSEVLKAGCGVGQEPRVDFGKVTRPVRRTETDKYIRHSAMTVPGDSGCPVFYKYKVVGMATHISVARNVPVFGMAYALPIGRLQTWSKENDGFYDHVFEKTAKMPNFPRYQLELLNDYEFSE